MSLPCKCDSHTVCMFGVPEECFAAQAEVERQAAAYDAHMKALQSISQGRGSCGQRHCADVADEALAAAEPAQVLRDTEGGKSVRS